MRVLIQSLVIALAFGISSTSMASAEDAPAMGSAESAAPAESAASAESAKPAEATPPATSEDGVTSRGLIPTRVRPLTTTEVSLARSVFQDTINYNLVRVTDALGFGDRPWTTNTPPIYTLNVGSLYYASLSSDAERRRLLIHELTHVWQGQHLVPFIFDSAAHQTISAITNGGNVAVAYSYTLGRAWREYNVEQQASIVTDWYVRGRQTSDARYRYIRDNIRSNNIF